MGVSSGSLGVATGAGASGVGHAARAAAASFGGNHGTGTAAQQDRTGLGVYSGPRITPFATPQRATIRGLWSQAMVRAGAWLDLTAAQLTPLATSVMPILTHNAAAIAALAAASLVHGGVMTAMAVPAVPVRLGDQQFQHLTARFTEEIMGKFRAFGVEVQVTITRTPPSSTARSYPDFKAITRWGDVFSNRIAHRLDYHISNFNKLCQLTERDLGEMRGSSAHYLGKVSIAEIKAVLLHYGLHLGMTPEEAAAKEAELRANDGGSLFTELLY